MLLSAKQMVIPFRIETYESLVSTQDAMRERLKLGDDVHGLVIRAGEQTTGHGQRANSWQSGFGGSYQTLAVRDPAPPALRQGISTLAVAVGLAETLLDYGVDVGIKWPNDLYYRRKKLAGVLSEYVQDHLLIGVGMNVNNDVPEGAVGLRGWDVAGVHALVLAGVKRGLEHLLTSPSELPERFTTFDLLANQSVTFSQGDAVLTGTAQGITNTGCLRILTTERHYVTFHGQLQSVKLRTDK